MLIEYDLFINFQLSTRNTLIISKAEEILNSLNVGDRLLSKKKQFMVCLIINLRYLVENQVLIIQRNKNWYAKRPIQYYSSYQRYALVINILDELVRKGYLLERKHVKKITTTGYIPTQKFLDIINLVNLDDVFTIRPENLIVLRQRNHVSKKNVEIHYDNTPLTISMQGELNLYSNLREDQNISLQNLPLDLYYEHQKYIRVITKINLSSLTETNQSLNIPLKTTYLSRIFNDDFSRGGRFYRGCESKMPKKVRKHIFINGNPTIEIDYVALHIRMLYNLRGRILKKDPYNVEPNMTPELRKIYKKIVLISLNSTNIKKAFKAIRKKLAENNLVQFLPDTTNETLKKYIDNFIAKNRIIEDDLFSEKSHLLTNLDSQIANRILMHFANQGILVLCVHDSFIIEQQHEDELKIVMLKEYKRLMGFTAKVK